MIRDNTDIRLTPDQRIENYIAQNVRTNIMPSQSLHDSWYRSIVGRMLALVLAGALLALDNRLWPLSLVTRRSIAIVVLLAAAYVTMRSGVRWRAARTVGILAILVFLAQASSVVGALAAFVLIVALIQSGKGGASDRELPAGVCQAFMTYVLGRAVLELIPQSNRLIELIAQQASFYIGFVGHKKVVLSTSVICTAPLIFVIAYLIWRVRLIGGMPRLIVALILPIAWFMGLPIVFARGLLDPTSLFGLGALYSMMFMAFGIVIDKWIPKRQELQKRTSRVPCGCLSLSAALSGICLVGTTYLESPSGQSVLVFNRGGLDWDRPVFGRFGMFTGGMFGLLPVYASAQGYKFDVLDKNEIAANDLKGVQVLVLINAPKQWSSAEKSVIRDFIRHGGNLLVLGDHTDVFGLMRGFNGLLGEYGIQFKFDSAYRVRDGWRGCQIASSDAVAWGWDERNPSVSVGASLDLSGSARPLLVGRFGFSDAGVRNNHAGSFLGNYRYEEGERLGDLVLIATTSLGEGRVVVFGDTSAFQGGLSHSYGSVVGPMLAWLSRPLAWTDRPTTRLFVAIGTLVFAMWLFVAAGSPQEVATVAFCFTIGLFVPLNASTPRMEKNIIINKEAVLIDYTHLPAVGHYEARVNPISPLYTNLFRSGFRVIDFESWNASAIRHARGVIFVAPQKPFTSSEVAELLEAEEDGAIVFLVVGQPDSAASTKLLQGHGLRLAPRPLGTVTSADVSESRRTRERQPRFFDAWPIVARDGSDLASMTGVEVIFRYGEDVIALFARKGGGGLVLISDTRFFSDMNVEDANVDPWLGNIALIHNVFTRYLKANTDSVKPLFRSPEKPQ